MTEKALNVRGAIPAVKNMPFGLSCNGSKDKDDVTSVHRRY
jgi:hypothetical protein